MSIYWLDFSKKGLCEFYKDSGCIMLDTSGYMTPDNDITSVLKLISISWLLARFF